MDPFFRFGICSALLVGLSVGNADAGAFRVSFLDDPVSIESTTNFLLHQGCDQRTVNSFCRALSEYDSETSDLNLARFPRKTDGFYAFESVTDVVEALDRPLIYVRHRGGLNCFDADCLLSANFIRFRLSPDDIGGPFLMQHTMTNGDVGLALTVTPRDAFDVARPAWAIEATKGLFDATLETNRMNFTAAFETFNFFPGGTTPEALPAVMFKTLKLGWERCGVVFPKQAKIIIFHSASLKEHNSVSTHAGILFTNDGRYLYLEKAGPSGPYVRLDFDDINDLFVWYKVAIKPNSDQGNFLFATLNDERIYPLN
jgi:hypothetical protein